MRETRASAGIGASVGSILLWGLLVSGCGVPRPPLPVNAVLPDDAAVYDDQPLDGDTVVVARCRECAEFAKRVKGDWEDHWLLVTADVLKVERGSWGEPVLRFVVIESWPTPESGIRLKKAAWPYRAGAVFAFALDTTVRPARIVGQQRQDARPGD